MEATKHGSVGPGSFVALLAAVLTLLAASARAATWYISPTGSDSNPGTEVDPFLTIMEAQSKASSGDIVYILDGTNNVPNSYNSIQDGVYAVVNYITKSGITYASAPTNTARPVFDFSAINPTGYRVAAFWLPSGTSNVTFQGFDVMGVQENITNGNNQSIGMAVWGCTGCTWNEVNVHDADCVGFYLEEVSISNLWYRCDSYNNAGIDAYSYGNADGFGCHPAAGGVGNVIRECRSWNNSDDGYDCIDAYESVTFDHCWSYLNGNNGGNGNGFKGGGWGCSGGAMPATIPVHTVQFCLAALNNGNGGFYANHQPGQAANWMNNTSYDNATDFNMLEGNGNESTNCSVDGTREVMHYNLAYQSTITDNYNETGAIVSSNSWTETGVTPTAADFVSTSYTQMTNARQADGSMPVITFMHLTSAGAVALTNLGCFLVPPVPTGLTATGGAAQVVLSWPACAWAAGYNVYRSSAIGGPYTNIAMGVPGAGYTDTGLSNGTTYYYEVAAINPGDQSANSSPASATTTVPANTPTTTTLALTAGYDVCTYGASLTFQATVSPTPPNGETITFHSGTTSLGTATTLGGEASLTIDNLPASSLALAITATYAGDANYAASTSSALGQMVNQATLTYTANPAVRPYDTANPVFSGKVTGFVNGETQGSATTGTLEFTSTATTASPAGSYPIDGSGLSANNYSFAQAAANASALTISPGGDVWDGAGADNNWKTAGNWASGSANSPPLAGDALVFSGTTRLNPTNNFAAGTSFSGLTFSPGAGAFILVGDSIAATGALTDNAASLETIDIPVVLPTSQVVNVAGGGSMVMNGVISGTGFGLTKSGGGTLTLTGEAAGADTYTGATTVSGGTLTLDFTQGGSTPAANIVPSSSPLSLAGGTLAVLGASSSTAQAFAGVTVAGGQSAVTASGTGVPTIALGGVSELAGGTVEINGAATIGAGNSSVAATANITTTSPGGGTLGVLTSGGGYYATVGLYDWASTDTTAGGAGASPYTIIGGSQVAGFYTTLASGGVAAGENVDLTGNNSHGTSTVTIDTVRFNTAASLTFAAGSSTGSPTCFGGVLVTPNVGANNSFVTQVFEDSRGTGNLLDVFQNNTSGWLEFTGQFNDSKNAPGAWVFSGLGTVSLASGQANTGQTYLNGPVVVITASSCLGAAATGAQINMNGGSIFGDATFALDNAGANPRNLVLTNNGGGLAALTGQTMTVDGIISGPGPLTIGIAPSGANGNSVSGRVPGTGSGTANATELDASGTVALSGANTYAGGTVLDTGTLNFAAGALGVGGLTFNGGTLQWGTATTTDISAQLVTINSGGGTLDVNGETVTLANAIGNGGAGGVTVKSSATGGGLNLNGGGAYGGNTSINGIVLVLGGAGQLGGGAYAGNITNNGGFTYGSSAAQTLSGVISGTGALTQNGPGRLTLSAANTYSASTAVNGGTLALASTGSLPAGSSISIAAGTTLDVSSQAAYTLGASASLTASGNSSPASVVGAAGGIVSLGSNPVILNYDGSHPALTVAQGTLQLEGNAFTVNGSPLAGGTYPIVQQASGTISSSGTFPAPTGTAIGANTTGSIAVNGGQVVLTVINTTPPVVTYSLSGGPLVISWPGDHEGWRLESNALDVSNPEDWFTFGGSQSNTSEAITIDPTQTNVFFRLIYP